MFYNIRIKSNKGEYILESYDKDIIQREMDLYFASMFGASDEFKSKIKEIDLSSKGSASYSEIEELKNVRENIVKDSIMHSPAAPVSNVQNSIAFKNKLTKALDSELNTLFGQNVSNNFSKIANQSYANNTPKPLSTEDIVFSNYNPLKENAKPSKLNDIKIFKNSNDQNILSDPIPYESVNINNIPKTPTFTNEIKTQQAEINITQLNPQPNKEVSFVNEQIQEVPVQQPQIEEAKPFNQIVFNDPQNPTSGYKIPDNHPDIQEFNTIMPDIQLEGALKSNTDEDKKEKNDIFGILKTSEENTPKQDEFIEKISSVANSENKDIKTDVIDKTSESSSNKSLGLNSLLKSIAEEKETGIDEIVSIKEGFDVENNTDDLKSDISSNEDKIIQTQEIAPLDIESLPSEQNMINAEEKPESSSDETIIINESTQNNETKEENHEPKEDNNSVSNILETLSGEISSLDISKDNDIDGNLLTMFEEEDAPMIEFSKQRLDSYSNTSDSTSNYNSFTQSQEQNQDDDKIEYETIDVLNDFKKIEANIETSNDETSAPVMQQSIIEDNPIINDDSEVLNIGNLNTPEISLADNGLDIKTNDAVIEKKTPSYIEAQNESQETMLQTQAVLNTAQSEAVSSNKEAAPDFKTYFSRFNTDLIVDKFLICAYYIKNILKQGSFTVKFLNSKLFSATGEIANIAVVEELIAQNYIEIVEAVGVKKTYAISQKGEQYLKDILQV